VDNLNKRNLHKTELCVFCAEKESITHLFFECTIAKCVWGMIRESMNVDIGEDYLSVAAKWLQKEKLYVINVDSAAERNMVNKE
jgi:hypothetical protein